MGTANHLLTQAGELVREKRWQDAVEIYLRATEESPSDMRCWCGLGVCLFKVGNFGMARVALQRAQKMGHPRASKALLWLAEAERESGIQPVGEAGPAVPIETAGTPAFERPPFAQPAALPEDKKIDLGRPVPIMLVEPVERDRDLITQAIEGTIKNAEVVSVPYTVSCADTLSRRVHYYVAVLDWDAEPNAAAGLTQILKIKRPEMLTVCLTNNWNPQKSAKILETGADYHLVKSLDLGRILPLIISQWARRDRAVLQQLEAEQAQVMPQRWPECLNALGEVMMLVGRDYKVLQANEAAMKLFQTSEARLIGRPYSTALYGTDAPPESCPLKKVLQSGRPTSENIYHTESETALRVQAWPVFSEPGRASAVIALLSEAGLPQAVGQDVQGGAEAMASVLNEGMDKLQCGIAVLDGEGRITWVSSLAADFLCADRDALIGKDYLELLSRSVRDLMAEPESFTEAVASAHRTGGSIAGRPFEVANSHEGTTLKYWSTPVQGGPPSVRRVEQYYPAEQVVKVSSPRPANSQSMDELAGAIGDMLFTIDQNGGITWSSAAAAETGYSEERLRGMPLADLAAPEARERVRNLLQHAIHDGVQTWKEEVVMTCANGKRRSAQLTLLPHENGQAGGPHAVEAVLHDVTHKQMTKAIRSILSGNDEP